MRNGFFRSHWIAKSPFRRTEGKNWARTQCIRCFRCFNENVSHIEFTSTFQDPTRLRRWFLEYQFNIGLGVDFDSLYRIRRSGRSHARGRPLQYHFTTKMYSSAQLKFTNERRRASTKKWTDASLFTISKRSIVRHSSSYHYLFPIITIFFMNRWIIIFHFQTNWQCLFRLLEILRCFHFDDSLKPFTDPVRLTSTMYNSRCIFR